MENHLYRSLTDKELDERIDNARANSHISSSEYHKLVAEKSRRKEQERKNTEDLIFKNVTQRLDNIIKLLEIISKNPIKSVLIGIAITITTGVCINVATNILIKIFPLLK